MDDITRELIKKIRKIQFYTTCLANDVIAGAYRSAFRGTGIEFEDIREYQPGDDIRTIDWNSTAKADKVYVKRFREERDLTLTLIIDVSASTRYGTKSCLKQDLITELAAVLAFSAINNHDKISLLLFSDQVEIYLPPKSSTRHVLRVIRELLAFSPKQRGSNISTALSYLLKIQKRTGICFLISDFICPDFSHHAALIAKKHDLIAVAIIDPSEQEFPEMNLVNVRDLETGEQRLIDTSKQYQQHLKETLEQRVQSCHKLMKHIGATFLPLYTDRPYLPELRKLFKVRSLRH